MKVIATYLSATVLALLLWLISLPVLITPSEAATGPCPSTIPCTTTRGAPGPVLGAAF